MSPVQRKANVAAMHLQLKRFAASVDQYAARRGYQREWAWKRSLVNNVQWWTKTSAKEFLEKLGRFIRIGPMLGRDTYVSAFTFGGFILMLTLVLGPGLRLG